MNEIPQPLILVTGATGFIGEAVVRELHEAGYAIRLITRQAARGEKLARKYGAEIVEANLYEPAEVARACAGVQAVIHLVGIIHQTFGDPFEKVHVEATRSVVAGAKLAGIQRYLHMSALGTGPESRSAYHQTKWAAENIVRKSGLNWTIFRPSLVFGPGDGFVNFFAKFLTLPLIFFNLFTFPRLGGGRTLFQPIAVVNVAQAFVRALSHEAAIGRTFDLCGEERLSLTEILGEIIRVTGREFQIEEFPLLTLSRHLLWAACLLIPVVGIPAAIFLQGGQPAVILLVLIWIGLLGSAIRWTTIILFTLPWWTSFLMASLIQNIWIGGQPLITVDQILMLQQGNVGNCQPAREVFHLQLLAFRPGIRQYLGVQDS